MKKQDPFENIENAPILVDVNSRGKVIDWENYHKGSIQLSHIYKNIAYERYSTSYEKRALNLFDCGKHLIFVRDKRNGQKRLQQAYFCKERLCPMCQWRRSTKYYLRLKKIVSQMDTIKNPLLLITLTVPNCELTDLRATLKQQNSAFNRLRGYVAWKRAYSGFYRTTEITYDESKDNPCNTHMHILVSCNEGYFKKNSEIYITQDKLTEMWRKALKLPPQETVIVDIRRVGKGKVSNLAKSLNEVAKYVVKSTDYIDKASDPEAVVFALNNAMENLRFMGMGGTFKTIAQQLRIDLENDDLVNLDEQETIKGIPKEYAEIVHYLFTCGVYREIEVTTVEEYYDYYNDTHVYRPSEPRLEREIDD